MTATETAPEATASPRKPARVSFTGIGLIAALELKQRVRSTKWIWALIAFGLLVGAVTLLLTGAMNSFDGGLDDENDVIFGVIVFFVLFLGLLVSPTLSATAINGDAKEGTLAPLQATTLAPADLVLGKLLGSWVASLAFLVVALPFIAFSYVISDAPAGAIIVTVLVLAVELLVVCALGLGWSALTGRTAASAVLTYVTVASLAVLSPVFFGLTIPLVTEPTTVRIYDGYNYTDEGYAQECRWREETWDQPHTERTWWLLAINPFVIVADAAPSNDDVVADRYYQQTMLGSIKYAVREGRLGPQTVQNYCWLEEYDTQFGGPELTPEELERREQLAGLGAVWPWGLAVHTLLAAGSVWIAIRRVHVPYGKLSAGQRVA